MRERTRIRDIVEKVRATDGWHLDDRLLRRGEPPDWECPLTAGTGASAGEYDTVEDEIGFPALRVGAVISAADGYLWRRRHRVVRSYLLEAAGLPEES